jgi:site-specific DNA-cytosine methylase
LPDVLEAEVHPRFYLSPRAAAGILRRAEKRGKDLPPALASALQALSASDRPEATPNSTDTEPMSPLLSPKDQPEAKASATQDADERTTSTPSVRRLTPTECERLQGFPDGWTILSSSTGKAEEMSDTATAKPEPMPSTKDKCPPFTDRETA